MGTGVSGFATYAHFDELNDVLDTQAGVLSPVARKVLARKNLGIQGVATAGAITPLTDSSGGSASGTIAAIAAGGSYAQADLVAIKNALASIVAQQTAIINALKLNA